MAGDYTILDSRFAGDLNGDCVVDVYDFSTPASQWLDCNIEPPEFCWE